MNETIDKYINTVELLKLVLKFYADESNYIDINDKCQTLPILLDCGTQARFALEKISELDELNKSMENEYLNYYLNIENNDENN